MGTTPQIYKRKSKIHQLAITIPPPWVSALIGQRFIRLVILSYSGFRSGNHDMRYHYVEAQCDCGNKKVISASHLKSGDIKSCGCLHREIIKTNNVKHNHANPSLRGVTPTYRSWAGMRSRCHSPTNKKFYRYGARGIKVCFGWFHFSNFLADMGERPIGKTIDRIGNDGHYSCGDCEECRLREWPANCHWGTPIEQANNQSTNKKLVFKGELLCVTEIERRLGWGSDSLAARLRAGWTEEEALNTPLRKRPSQSRTAPAIT